MTDRKAITRNKFRVRALLKDDLRRNITRILRDCSWIAKLNHIRVLLTNVETPIRLPQLTSHSPCQFLGFGSIALEGNPRRWADPTATFAGFKNGIGSLV
jgi:hypothetical protein